MMKKKLFAALTAFISLASTTGSFTVFAEETVTEVPSFEMVVIGADDPDDPQNYLLIDTATSYNLASIYYLYDHVIESRLVEGTLQHGDIVEFYGGWFSTAMGGANPIETYSSNPIESTYIKVTGSIFDEGYAETYTIAGVNPDYSMYGVLDDEGTKHRSYYKDLYCYTHYGYFDWESAKPGDEVTMYTYKDVPCLPVEINPLGDVNSDSTLNVLDVIIMNKHLLTGSDLPALAKARSTGESDLGQCDFNGNGVIDPDDSLSMLKRIIGLETIEVE